MKTKKTTQKSTLFTFWGGNTNITSKTPSKISKQKRDIICTQRVICGSNSNLNEGNVSPVSLLPRPRASLSSSMHTTETTLLTNTPSLMERCFEHKKEESKKKYRKIIKNGGLRKSITNRTKKGSEENVAADIVIPNDISKNFREVGFGKWGRDWIPIIEVGPDDVADHLSDEWMESFHKKKDNYRHLIYFYGSKLNHGYAWFDSKEWLSKFTSFENGKRKGYLDIPLPIQKKIENKQTLSRTQRERLDAKLQINIDFPLPKEKRIAWLTGSTPSPSSLDETEDASKDSHQESHVPRNTLAQNELNQTKIDYLLSKEKSDIGRKPMENTALIEKNAVDRNATVDVIGFKNNNIIEHNFSTQHQPCEYEMRRLERIKRNEEHMRKLGLIYSPLPKTYCNNTMLNDQRSTSKTKKRKKTATSAVISPNIPTRRSSRNKGIVLIDQDTGFKSIPSKNNHRDDDTYRIDQEEEDNSFINFPGIKYPLESYNHEDGNNQSSSSFWDFNLSTEFGRNIGSDALEKERDALFQTVGPRLIPPPGLTAIYSLNFCSQSALTVNPQSNDDQMVNQNIQNNKNDAKLLVGSGKSGNIAIWDITPNNDRRMKENEDEDSKTCEKNVVLPPICSRLNDTREPLLSWKGHGGRWISDACFIQASAQALESSHLLDHQTRMITSEPFLLTAANDGCVCIWDLCKTSLRSGAPKLIHQTGQKGESALHSGGIFSMNVVQQQQPSLSSSSLVLVGTGSKDKTIAVSTLACSRGGEGVCDSSLTTIWRSSFHSSKVGCVRIHSKAEEKGLVASVSDDGYVAIHDYKHIQSKANDRSTVVACLKDAHVKPHSFEWNPLDEHLFLTAGFDDELKTWDLRSLKMPLRSFRGHIPNYPIARRYKKIHRPIFYVPTTTTTSWVNSTKLSASLSSSHLLTATILTGGEGSNSVSLFRNLSSPLLSINNNDTLISEKVFSRGTLPADCAGGDVGAIACHGRQAAISIDGGEVILLDPKIQHNKDK